EGIRNIEEAWQSELQIDTILYNEQLLKTERGCRLYRAIEKKKIETIKISENELQNISHSTTPQGILAICQKFQHDFAELIKGNIKSLVILDAIQDPGNLGTIIRTADAAGVSGIIVGKGTVDIYNPKVLSSAMGSLLHVPVVKVDDLPAAIRRLKEKGIRILACDVHAEKNYLEVNYRYPLGVIFGNEGAGLHKDIIDLADEALKIPIMGKAESLNVGIACGIVLYKMQEGRNWTGTN
ncbi:MAG: RNA methyltransferase, partial [bacterium]